MMTKMPVPATEADYLSAASELEEALIALPGAVAVYGYGSVTAPGISDIDRLVVIENGASLPDLWSQLSERTQQLAMHSAALLDPPTFTHHRWFGHASNLKHVWGERFEVKPCPLPAYTEPLLAAEGLVITALKLAKLAVTGHVKIRPLLCELANVRLDLRLARIDRSAAPAAWELSDVVQSIRNEWWRLDHATRISRLRAMLHHASDALADGLGALAMRMEPADRPAALRLGAPWSNVTLLTGKGNSEPSHTLTKVIAPWRRLGEARWRCVHRRFYLRQEIITLLTGPPPKEYEDLRAERDELVRGYGDFLALNPGYSSVGLATLFLPPPEFGDRRQFARVLGRFA